jgi:uncharacterized membrane protein YqaE (UPF0057 family)
MNKLLIQIILFAFGIATLSSCSKEASFSLTKRHYRSGYYVDFGTKSHSVNYTYNKPVKTVAQVPAVASVKSEDFNNVPAFSIASEKVMTVKKIIDARKSVASKNKIAALNSAERNPFAGNSSITNTSHEDAGTATNDVRVRVYVVNVPFVIILLCAIFIPPLGVGLMYGLNSYFWIDLLLTLLFFIPGMIFALVVVLM